ncbi:MAG: ATP synthase F1 subunit gamma [candidate division WOR-3 bacterium]
MIPLRDIRRQIAGIRKISNITRAMKTVSAIRLARVQGRVVRQRPYAQTLRGVIADLIARTGPGASPLLASPASRDRTGKIRLVVAIGSDRGLCGAFNSSLVQRAARFLLDPGADQVIVIGKRLRDLLHSRKIRFDRFLADFLSDPIEEHIHQLAVECQQQYLSGSINELWVIYTEFRSAARQAVTAERLLPIGPEALTPEPLFPEYHYEPDQPTVLSRVLPAFYQHEWRRVVLESEASEHIARMRAMDMATINAGELIAELTLVLNKARQELITRELAEISSAAETLRNQ